MKIQFGKQSWGWRVRVLPTIEYTNCDKFYITEVYGCKHQLFLRWLNLWASVTWGYPHDN